VSRALVPVAPSSPGVLLILAIALTGGVAVASGLVLVAENMARGYRSRQALEADVGVACYGVCPQIEARDIPVAGRMHGRRPLMPATGGLVAALTGGSEWGPGYRRGITRYCLDRPHGAFADAIRAVRLGIFGTNIKTRPRSVVITSALPGEGKSTVAANLANDLARSGLTVLLVDADFRRASLTQLLAGPGFEGLSEVLGGQTSMKRAVVYNPDTGLFFLPAGLGAGTAAAGDLLAGRAFSEFLRHYANSFDAVIIDGPPVLSSPDAAALLDTADGTLFVVQWEKTPRDAAMAALNASPFNRHKIKGCLLNKADRRELASYGYSVRRIA
ncbi:MAG: AAA family ATPase, partial [Hyphomicrobiales bacterium]